MVAFFTRAPGSICHHLQLLHKPHFERFMAISPFEPIVFHNSADQEFAFVHDVVAGSNTPPRLVAGYLADGSAVEGRASCS